MLMVDVFAPGLWSGRPVAVSGAASSPKKTDSPTCSLKSILSHLFFGLSVGGGGLSSSSFSRSRTSRGPFGSLCVL